MRSLSVLLPACGFMCFLSAAPGCGVAVPPHADPNDYRRDCRRDEDCVLVFHQDCSPGGCGCGADGSINVEDRERFTAHESEVRCYRGPALSQCDCVDDRVAVCSEGVCQISGE